MFIRKMIAALLCVLAVQHTQAQTGSSWFRAYKGTVGKAGFTLLLHKAGFNYDGYIYYTNTQHSYGITGQDQKAATLLLSGIAPGNDDIEKWQVSFAGKIISGKFIHKNKTLSFTADEITIGIPIEYVYVEKTERLHATDPGSPRISFYQSGTWFTRQADLNKLLWPNCIEKTAGQYFLENRNDFYTDYKKEYGNLTPAEYKDASFMYSHEQQSKMLLSYLSEKLLVFSTDWYSYSGGAHGNFGTTHQVVDRRYNKLLSLQDIILDTAALSGVLEKKYRLQYNVPADQPLDEAGLFDNHIRTTENFFLSSKGIGFTYDPYAIAPYAAGQIELFIPVSEIKDLVSDYAKGLFQF